MKKIWLIILFLLWLGLVIYWIWFLLLSSTSWDKNPAEESEIIFSWNLRTDYELSCVIKQTTEWSGWRYIIEINPIDKWYRYDKQPQITSFLSDVKLENLVQIPNTEYPDEIILTAPELWLRITHSNIEVDDNFWLYCPAKDLDEFIIIPWWEWELTSWRYKEICIDYDCKDLYSLWINDDAYQFMRWVKYINHYKSWDISMFYERWDWGWLIIDDAENFWKNCMIEIWEIENFLPLNLPFELNFNNFDYTTIWFIRELSDSSDCLSSNKLNSPHNNYISFYTEDMACQLWYESWTTLESIIFENALKNITF